MKNINFKTISNILALAILPFLGACSGGGGGGLASLGLGSLFAGGEAVSLAFDSGSAMTLSLLESTGGGIPVVHNPEPATMILLGTGMAAMAYFRGKK